MCGIFGVFGASKAAECAVIGLHGNQHRALEFAGIATSDGTNLYREVGAGLARQVFDDPRKLNRLHGRHAVGHVRYSTVEKKEDDLYRDNTQPILGTWQGQRFALAHNGNLTNVRELSARLRDRPMETSMDSEYIVRLIEQMPAGLLEEELPKVFRLLKGSYSLALLFPDRLIAVRDPRGNRPLSLGRRDESWFVSSETCGFGGLGADLIRDVDAGQMVFIEYDGIRSFPFAEASLKECRFEGNYFSHPSSYTFGEPVDEYRIALGRALEQFCPAPGADIVTPVPDSANFIAMGFASSGRSGTLRPVIVRSHYVGRSFIAAAQVNRDDIVAQKFSFTAHAIKGKSIVVIDDSIVRGTTLRKVITEMRRYEPREIHVRSASPRIKHPCRYGVDFSTQNELIAATSSQEEMRKELGADSLLFLPLEVQKELSPTPDRFCYACMDGQYWD